MNNQIGRLHQNNYQEEDQKDEHASHHYWIVTRARGEGVKYVIAHVSTTYIILIIKDTSCHITYPVETNQLWLPHLLQHG